MFSRRKAMLINNMFAFIGGSLMGLSKLCSSFEMMVLGRLVIGAYCGQCSSPPIKSQHEASTSDAHFVCQCLFHYLIVFFCLVM